jgi:hypothetical protein
VLLVQQARLRAAGPWAARPWVPSLVVQPALLLAVPAAGRCAREIGARFCRAPALFPAPAAVRKVLPEFSAQAVWALPLAIGLEVSQLAVLPLVAPAAGRHARAIGALFYRAPSLVPAPAAAPQVLSAVAVRQAQASPLAVEHEALPAAAVQPGVAAAVAVVQPDVAEEVGAEPAEAAAVAAPVVPAELPSGRPGAAAWACRQDPLPPWPAPPPSAMTARVMELSPIAWPQELLSWQAALIVALSCAWGPEEL